MAKIKSLLGVLLLAGGLAIVFLVPERSDFLVWIIIAISTFMFCIGYYWAGALFNRPMGRVVWMSSFWMMPDFYIGMIEGYSATGRAQCNFLHLFTDRVPNVYIFDEIFAVARQRYRLLDLEGNEKYFLHGVLPFWKELPCFLFWRR